ncbi:MAG: DUF86 domain-containing protein [Spirochaetales bacterium]|nr:DUF86 domain-containing protein [Spirochaetales bacterium]
MNDVIINKSASIQRCVKRAREEYELAAGRFSMDYTRQDAAVLNLTRACEQAIDLANYVIRQKKLGIPATSGDSFTLLATASLVPVELAEKLRRMAGFRNIAIHEYQRINVDIVTSIIHNDSEDLVRFTEEMLKRYGG